METGSVRDDSDGIHINDCRTFTNKMMIVEDKNEARADNRTISKLTALLMRDLLIKYNRSCRCG